MSPLVGAAVAVALLATASLAAAADQPASAGRTPPSAAWLTLGTAGGPPLHGEVAPIANARVVQDAVYRFDVGNSVLRQLVLTHYVPTLSTLGDAAALKQRISRRYRGTVSLARDLDRF